MTQPDLNVDLVLYIPEVYLVLYFKPWTLNLGGGEVWGGGWVRERGWKVGGMEERGGGRLYLWYCYVHTGLSSSQGPPQLSLLPQAGSLPVHCCRPSTKKKKMCELQTVEFSFASGNPLLPIVVLTPKGIGMEILKFISWTWIVIHDMVGGGRGKGGEGEGERRGGGEGRGGGERGRGRVGGGGRIAVSRLVQLSLTLPAMIQMVRLLHRLSLVPRPHGRKKWNAVFDLFFCYFTFSKKSLKVSHPAAHVPSRIKLLQAH